MISLKGIPIGEFFSIFRTYTWLIKQDIYIIIMVLFYRWNKIISGLKYRRKLMNSWNDVVGISEVTTFFGEPISFHDAEVVDIKYDGSDCYLQIDCHGLIKTREVFDEQYKILQNVIIDMKFSGVDEFQIDGGYGFIDEICLEENRKKIVTIKSCGLKFRCDQIMITKVVVRTNQPHPNAAHNRLLDAYLKSDL